MNVKHFFSLEEIFIQMMAFSLEHLYGGNDYTPTSSPSTASEVITLALGIWILFVSILLPSPYNSCHPRLASPGVAIREVWIGDSSNAIFFSDSYRSAGRK